MPEAAETADADTIADPGHDWGYASQGTAQMPPIPTQRGKVLGGSSAVNAAVALRARPADFANWGSHGADGYLDDDSRLASQQVTGHHRNPVMCAGLAPAC